MDTLLHRLQQAAYLFGYAVEEAKAKNPGLDPVSLLDKVAPYRIKTNLTKEEVDWLDDTYGHDNMLQLQYTFAHDGQRDYYRRKWEVIH